MMLGWVSKMEKGTSKIHQSFVVKRMVSYQNGLSNEVCEGLKTMCNTYQHSARHFMLLKNFSRWVPQDNSVKISSYQSVWAVKSSFSHQAHAKDFLIGLLWKSKEKRWRPSPSKRTYNCIYKILKFRNHIYQK